MFSLVVCHSYLLLNTIITYFKILCVCFHLIEDLLALSNSIYIARFSLNLNFFNTVYFRYFTEALVEPIIGKIDYRLVSFF